MAAAVDGRQRSPGFQCRRSSGASGPGAPSLSRQLMPTPALLSWSFFTSYKWQVTKFINGRRRTWSRLCSCSQVLASGYLLCILFPIHTGCFITPTSKRKVLWTEYCIPPYVETLIPNMMVFGDGGLWGVVSS